MAAATAEDTGHESADQQTPPAPTPLPPPLLRPVPLAVVSGALLPNIVVAAALFAVPVVLVLVYAFATLDFETLDVHWGWTLDPLRQALRQPYLGTVLRSVEVASATVAGCLVLGFAVAHTLAGATGRRRSVLLALVLLPFWTSFIVRTYAWTNLIGPGGLLTRFTGLLGHQVVLLGTSTGVLMGMLSAYLPMMILPVYVALDRLPAVLVEAARDLGASEWRILLTVRIPAAAPGLAAGALLVGIPASGEYVVPAVLGRGKQLLVGNLISAQLQENGNYPLGAALTGVLLVTVGLVLAAAVVLRHRLRSRAVPA